MQIKSRKINWLNVGFFTLTPLVGVIGTIMLCHFDMVKWQTWVFFGIYTFITELAVTAGYHRLFSHRTYKASPVVRFVMAILGSACFQGSVLEWGTDHRNHHLHVDTEKDPHNINQGFWHAHLGWIFHLDSSRRDYSNVKDLSASAFLRFHHKYYEMIAVFMAFILPMLIASLWGNALAGLIVVGVLGMVVNHHSTFFINSLCHSAGKRPYSEKQTARDNWLTALVTMGEGFHNFHHQFPLDYRNGVRYFHYDPTKWLIYGLSKIGLTSDLKRINHHKILSFRLCVEENRLRRQHQQNELFISQNVEPLKAHMMTLIEKITLLEAELAILKKKKVAYVKERYHSYKSQLHTYLETIQVAQQELNESLVSWRQLCA